MPSDLKWLSQPNKQEPPRTLSVRKPLLMDVRGGMEGAENSGVPPLYTAYTPRVREEHIHILLYNIIHTVDCNWWVIIFVSPFSSCCPQQGDLAMYCFHQALKCAIMFLILDGAFLYLLFHSRTSFCLPRSRMFPAT